MNEEFFVEPSSFSNVMELKYLLEKFGFFQGRFIGQYPRYSKWKKGIYSQLGNLPDIEKAKVSVLLTKHEKVFVPLEKELDPTVSWLENAHQQVENKQISGVITARPNQWGYPSLDEVDNDYLLGGHGVRILNKAQYYTEITRRLLLLSHEIVLVDPYLHLNKPACEKVLTRFFEVAQQDNGKCQSLVIWARDEKAGMKGYRQMLERKYKSKLSKGSRLTVKLVDDEGSIEKMHARLMLSVLGGFSFDKGFAEDINEKFVDVAILDKQTHDHHCRWYLDPGSPNDFDIVEEHIVEG